MASRLKEEFIVNKNDETEELLVFGYSCKLFRDDERALYIDQGKHLIPWMGDDSLKIDRYDARGTLFDLKQVEAPIGGFDRYFGLTDMEKQVETMCDEERYRALFTNEEEETMYQEEELKRLHYAISDKKNSYGQVEYKYDDGSNYIEENCEEKSIVKIEETGDDEPFVPSPQLDLPVNMIVPETIKHNAIIEKTAMFISDQGPQMEILLKMKQAGNPQFNFLSFDNPLHNYYRHLLMAIKGGRFKPDLLDSSGKKSDAENDEDEYYLHPSLASSVSRVELAPSIPSINYKPSAHCAYSMLVNKIKDKKHSEQGNQLCKFKEALECLNETNKNKEGNGSYMERNFVDQYSSLQSYQTPPNDTQMIIDKMASYVAKNGRDFEAVVQMKKDPRFDFLNSSHAYYGYYQYKLKQYESLEKLPHTQKSARKASENLTAPPKSRDETKNKLAPVSFSIKKPKDLESVIERSALPVEESSDEEGKLEKGKECDVKEDKERDVKEDIVTIDLAAQEEKEEKYKKILAAERLKDKLTAAAREKVALASREKQLQQDRKRRAAVFLKKIQPEPVVKGSTVYGPQLPDADRMREEEESDVASLPDAWEECSDNRNKLTRCRDKEKNCEKADSVKRQRSTDSDVRHKHREKHRLKSDRQEEVKVKEINERISESSENSGEDDCKRRRSRRTQMESEWRRKSWTRSKSTRKEDRRHKRKKHKKEMNLKEPNMLSKRHSKAKKQKRSRESDDNRNSRSKRSRTNSTDSSDFSNT